MSNPPVGVEAVGWASSAILLVTIARQVYSQWKSKASGGVSKWLFVGQISASLGYVVYSWLLHNWVFFVSNLGMIITAILGEWIFLMNRRPEQRAGSE